MEKQLSEMLALQDQMNQKVHPQWRDQGYQWYRAIWTECAELMDHYGWKWWKKQTPELDQIKLEIVDIWHFGMSTFLVDSTDYDEVAGIIASQWVDRANNNDFLQAVEALASETLATRKMPIPAFCHLMLIMDMSVDELFRQYIGKNVLNFFRQDHGYKEGTYIKVWHGKEDNEVLAEVLNTLDAGAENFKNDLYQALVKHYPAD
ncbi:MAG: dUTP diphosphatase [Ketobacteraceae bacterium]|nr:dUTP diphosphatase [Ketobacteraceae bacterium]